ncbi:hypothetical protein M0R45_002022 [Rubus argutus]|uniref:Uncharacterized protein n=1 Tax=Rubus argutus TaxID=59490 RepID=A0AAW1VK55_RUBAR
MASRGSLRRRAGRRRRRLCDLRSGLRSPIWVEHGAGSTARGRAGSTAELLAGSVMGKRRWVCATWVSSWARAREEAKTATAWWFGWVRQF